MKKYFIFALVLSSILLSCSNKSTRKRNLDDTLFKYAALIRWSDFDGATRYLKPGDEKIKPSRFDIDKLKQFKVSRYQESPIQPGNKENIVLQDVVIQLYNIHNNREKIIYDHQSWEFDEELKQWFLTSGLPKL